MRASFYLIANDTGSVRVSATKTDIRANEVALFMNMDFPDHLFHKPLLKANVEIEADEMQPIELKMKFDAIGDWLKDKKDDEEE